MSREALQKRPSIAPVPDSIDIAGLDLRLGPESDSDSEIEADMPDGWDCKDVE